jgi:hypothetical protein
MQTYSRLKGLATLALVSTLLLGCARGYEPVSKETPTAYPTATQTAAAPVPVLPQEEKVFPYDVGIELEIEGIEKGEDGLHMYGKSKSGRETHVMAPAYCSSPKLGQHVFAWGNVGEDGIIYFDACPRIVEPSY